ncbi:hypothetical protein HanIR_Chr09g0416411 [Helianthus annuus]|nr:hypothetical protein HanIR_Chr09g0416411 [Helianthus annuus]
MVVINSRVGRWKCAVVVVVGDDVRRVFRGGRRKMSGSPSGSDVCDSGKK